MLALAERLEGSAGVIVASAAASLAFIVGTILLAVALRRAELAPAWTAGALVVSQVVLFVDFGTPSRLIGFGLLAIGFGYIAFKIFAMPEAESSGKGERRGPG